MACASTTASARVTVPTWELHATFQSVQTTVRRRMAGAIASDTAAFVRESSRDPTAVRRRRTAIGRQSTQTHAFSHRPEVLRTEARFTAIPCSLSEVLVTIFVHFSRKKTEGWSLWRMSQNFAKFTKI